MKTIDNINYIADTSCFIVRKADKFIMGPAICLGDSDSMDNYEDQAYTEASYEEFYKSIGVDLEKKAPNRKIKK